MKKIAFWNNYTEFSNNQAFNPNAYGIGEDLAYPLILLKDTFYKNGVILETLDMDNVENYEKIIFYDVHDPKKCCVDLKSIPKEKKVVILEECEIIYKPNSQKTLKKEYSIVFSYNDTLVKQCEYVKLNMPNKIKFPKKIDFSSKKLITLIAGNKKSNEPGELYSERRRAINYFIRKDPASFDLYGIGWDKFCPTTKIGKVLLNRFPFINTLFLTKNKCYRGKVNKKIEVLSKYKFCICYENSYLIPGYISEKIMDCFFSGCVPIYFGAPNITDYIPKNCFIDYRDFSNYDQIYNFITSMREEKYNEYITAISNFLKSEKVYPFSAECFVDTIITEVLK